MNSSAELQKEFNIQQRKKHAENCGYSSVTEVYLLIVSVNKITLRVVLFYDCLSKLSEFCPHIDHTSLIYDILYVVMYRNFGVKYQMFAFKQVKSFRRT